MSIFAKYTGQRVSSLPAGYMQAEAQRANLISEGVKDFGRAIEGYAQQKAEDRIRDERIEALVGASTDPARQVESSWAAELKKAKEMDDLMLEERRRQIHEEQAAARQSVLDKKTQAVGDDERARLAEQAHGKAMTAHLEKHKRGVNALRGFAVPNAALRALGATAKMKRDQALASQAAATEAEAALPKFLEDKAKESNALVYTDAQDRVRAEPWKYVEAIESPEKLQEDMVNAVGPALLKKFQSGSATKGDKLVLLEKLENFSADKRQRGSLQGQRAQQLLDLAEENAEWARGAREKSERSERALTRFGALLTGKGDGEELTIPGLPGTAEEGTERSVGEEPESDEMKRERLLKWISENAENLGGAGVIAAQGMLNKQLPPTPNVPAGMRPESLTVQNPDGTTAVFKRPPAPLPAEAKPVYRLNENGERVRSGYLSLPDGRVVADPAVEAAGDVDAKLVQISGVTGSFEGTASSDKEAADFREALVAAEEAIPLLRKLYRMSEARDESGKKIFDATSNPWSEEGLRERGEATAARNILVGKLKLALTGGGAMSDQDVKRILDTVPNPYEFFSTDTASVAKIETLTKTLLDSVDSRARSYGIRRSGGFSDARKLLLAKDSELSTPSATTPAAPLPPAKFEMRGGKLVPVKPNPEQK